MSTQVTFLILFCATVLIFAEEIANVLKKIWKTPGIKLLLSLLPISTAIIHYDKEILYGLFQIQRHFYPTMLMIENSGALFKFFSLLSLTTLFTGVTFLFGKTVYAFINKRKQSSPPPFNFISNLSIWLLIAILFTVSYS